MLLPLPNPPLLHFLLVIFRLHFKADTDTSVTAIKGSKDRSRVGVITAIAGQGRVHGGAGHRPQRAWDAEQLLQIQAGLSQGH